MLTIGPTGRADRSRTRNCRQTLHRVDRDPLPRTSVSIVNFDLQSHGASRSFYFLQLRIRGTCIGWINEHTHTRGLWQQITEHLQPLRDQFGSENVDPGQIATWSRVARSQTNLDRVVSDNEDYRYGRRCRLGS